MIAAALFFLGLAHAADPVVAVGSKKFTESVVLGEMAREVLAHEGVPAKHVDQLGGTRLLWNALLAGDIDVYAEYAGTIYEEILRRPAVNFETLQRELARFGVGALAPLGFNNTYAIGMRRELADKMGIRKISDIAAHPGLKFGFSEEFRQRRDGWPGLKARYGLAQKFVRGLDHDIAYRALSAGDIDVIDLYSTDAEIAHYDLVILTDDLGYFPKYEALYLYRVDTAARLPEFLPALEKLSGAISNEDMIAMNRRAKIDQVPASTVAQHELNRRFGWNLQRQVASRTERILVRTREHLALVFISLALAILVAVPLGVFAEKYPLPGGVVLWLTGVVQTIPALAMLVVLIRPLNLIGLRGIGDTPALIALFLYSLLPIVRNTHSGFRHVPHGLKESAEVLGLKTRTRFLRVEFPLALPSILAGVKTSAVQNVGFATLGALVGAGGYGQPILTGVRLDDYGLILEGAVPAALLALLVQKFFDVLEDRLLPPGSP